MSTVTKPCPHDIFKLDKSYTEDQISDPLFSFCTAEETSCKLDCRLSEDLDLKSLNLGWHGKQISLTIVAGIIVVISWWYLHADLADDTKTDSLKSKYLIENLKGDTVDTWQIWKWVKDSPMDVVIINDANVPNSKLDLVKQAILSEESVLIDASVTHKGPKGTTSTYYVGWTGATSKLSQTKYAPPSSFNVSVSDKGDGRIVIRLIDMIDADGYSGYTKSTISENEILKAHITIYNANGLSDEQLATIVRHEFGHALGLGHATAPEDLMSPTIATFAPYVSECDIDALEWLYDGNSEDLVVCQS